MPGRVGWGGALPPNPDCLSCAKGKKVYPSLLTCIVTLESGVPLPQAAHPLAHCKEANDMASGSFSGEAAPRISGGEL